MNRDEAWQLLTEYTKSDSLLKHAMAVEAALRGYARQLGEDEEACSMISTTSAGRRSTITRFAAARSCGRKGTPTG